jgi:hypothetical protein
VTRHRARILPLFSPGISALVPLLLALGGDAAAATIQISYDITGGTFKGPNSTGSITGGSLSFLTVGANLSAGGGPGRLTKLTLTGDKGSFKFFGSAGFAGTAAFTMNFVSLTEKKSQPSIRTGTVDRLADYQYDGVSVTYGAGTGGVKGRIGGASGVHFTHSFTVGNEVRTLVPVPEPGTGFLLGMGVTVLAAAGRLGRSRARARRATAA